MTIVYSRKRGWFKLTLTYISFDLGSLRFISANTNEYQAGFKYRLRCEDLSITALPLVIELNFGVLL